MIFGIFLAALLGAVLLGTISDGTIFPTTTLSNTNETVTAPAVNATLDLTGRTLIFGLEVYNSTNVTPITVPGGILQTGVGTNGLQSVQLTLNDTAAAYAGQPVNVSYTYQPDGYLQNSGARSLTLLIVIISALAVVVVVIVYLFRGSLAQMMRRG